MYKKSIIMLRSLYLTVRLLPAYKLFRDLSSSGQIHTFTLAHRVSSFVEPFTSREEGEMQQFGFSPLDTPCGRLSLSVLYRPALSDVSYEPSTPMSPLFIPDYVGSPATDPLRRFPSLPVTGLVSQGLPSSVPFARRHSWSYDLYRAAAPSMCPSPSPTYSDTRASPSYHPSSHRLPPTNTYTPCYPPDTPSMSNASVAHEKNTSFDEYWPSPAFSPSPSPSPPTYFTGGHLSKALLRSESAPVSIPTAKPCRNPGLSNNKILPPSTPPKGTTENVRTPFRPGDTQTGVPTQKIPFPSSTSGLFFQDEFDDPEFACLPFVDDDDITDPRNRAESFDGIGHLNEPLDPGGLFPIRQSQDAVLGALVHMLKTAQPLRQDFSNSIKLAQVSKPDSWSSTIQKPDETSNSKAGIQNAPSSSGITSSGLLMLKTTADALEEFQSYREMKDSLLGQGSGSKTLANVAHAAESSGTGTSIF